MFKKVLRVDTSLMVLMTVWNSWIQSWGQFKDIISTFSIVTVLSCLLLSRHWLTVCKNMTRDRGGEFSTLGKFFSKQHIEIFFVFSQKTGLDIVCKLSPLETTCMKCQILFSGKNITNLASAEFAQRVVMVNIDVLLFATSVAVAK